MARVARHAVEVGAALRGKGLEAVEASGCLEHFRIELDAGVRRKMPAQPQAVSLVWRACGALSVPRKKRGSSPVAAATSDSRSRSRFSTGRQ